LNCKDIDELIEIISLDAYYAFVEREWGEDSDYSNCTVKTHGKKVLMETKNRSTS